MNFQQFATSRFGTRLWIALGHWLPVPVGHALARLITEILGRRRGSALYRAIYANQAGVLGLETSPAELHAATRAVLRHAGQVAYDLMHLVGRGEAAIRAAVSWEQGVREHLEAARAGGRGVMVCGCHLSNFNLALLALALEGLPVQILSMAAPRGGFALMRDLRAQGLIEETPIDGPALRAAIHRLRNGGIVITAVDWPLAASGDEPLPFFGRPALLPTGHIRLAISAGALLWPAACRWERERGYVIHSSPPLELELSGDRPADVRHNACRVLAVIERWIAETPEQWLMYYPVWVQEKGRHTEEPGRAAREGKARARR